MTERKTNPVLTGILCSIAAEALYGMSFIFSKAATEEVSTPALLMWRFLVAFIVINICAAVKLIKVDLKGKPKMPLVVLSLLFPCIYFIGETAGIRLTTASESGVIIGSIPIVTLIASTVLLKKKPTRFQTAGILTAFVGVIITVISVGTSAAFSLQGYLCLAVAVVSYALYCVCVDKVSGSGTASADGRSASYSSAEITYAMLTSGAAVFVVLAVIDAAVKGNIAGLAALPVTTPALLSAMLYQGIGCSVFAFFFNNIALDKIGVNGHASFVGLTTVISILSGALILKEKFTVYQIVGAVIIIAGVYIANIRTKADKQISDQ